jgi:hypothetical protein
MSPTIEVSDVRKFLTQVKGIVKYQHKNTFTTTKSPNMSIPDMFGELKVAGEDELCSVLASSDSFKALEEKFPLVKIFIWQMFASASSISKPMKLLLCELAFSDIITVASCIWNSDECPANADMSPELQNALKSLRICTTSTSFMKREREDDKVDHDRPTCVAKCEQEEASKACNDTEVSLKEADVEEPAKEPDEKDADASE